MAKLKDAQERCDKKKFVDSMEANRDLSGSMDYCAKCKFELGGTCVISHEERVKNNACGAAYNKFHRGNK